MIHLISAPGRLATSDSWGAARHSSDPAFRLVHTRSSSRPAHTPAHSHSTSAGLSSGPMASAGTMPPTPYALPPTGDCTSKRHYAK